MLAQHGHEHLEVLRHVGLAGLTTVRVGRDRHGHDAQGVRDLLRIVGDDLDGGADVALAVADLEGVRAEAALRERLLQLVELAGDVVGLHVGDDDATALDLDGRDDAASATAAAARDPPAPATEVVGAAEGDAARVIGADVEGVRERAGVLARQLQVATVVVGREACEAPLGRLQAVAQTVGPAILATHGCFPPWEDAEACAPFGCWAMICP